MAGNDRIVLFVCPHGAAKSRMAAAWFDSLAVPGWSAASAGVTPQPLPSLHPSRLLAGTPAHPLLDEEPPRPLDAVPRPDLVVAIDCGEDVEAAVTWQLHHQDFDAAMGEEIRDRVQALTADLTGRQDP